MSQARTLPPDRPFLAHDRDDSIGFRYSLALHFALFVFILLKTFVFPSKPVLILPALRVDLVGLPEFTKSELKNPLPLPADTKAVDQKAAPVAPENFQDRKFSHDNEKAAPDEMVLKPKLKESAVQREKRLKAALARIKALSKAESFEDAPPKSQLIKGNAISKGTSLSGEARESLETAYYDALRERLQENWGLPIWLARQNLSAQIILYVDRRGHLTRFIFTQLSGNAQFDSAIKHDIADSQPFPAPPDAVASQMESDGISVGFPL